MLVFFIIGAVAALIAMAWYAPYHYRPLFSNVFGRHEFSFLPAWQDQFADFVDRAGNFVLLDKRLNLVLVVIVPDQQKMPDLNGGIQKSLPIVRAIRQNATRRKIAFRLSTDMPEVEIARCSCQLVIVGPNAQILRANLQHHQAGAIRAKPAEYENDVLVVIDKFSNEPEVAEVLLQAKNMRSELWKD